MNIVYLLLFLLANNGDFFAAYPHDAKFAVETYNAYRAAVASAMGGASDRDVAMAFAIVAPEVSRYDVLLDFVEVHSLEKAYVSADKCDYSIGYFQMKPSFVESLEKEVAKDRRLFRKYGKRLAYAKGSAKEQRRQRLERLNDIEWQIAYLAVFFDVAKSRTAAWGIKSDEEKVRCWATLYNAGFYLSKERVKQRQRVKQFPRGTEEFNYSAVAVEFYRYFESL